MMLMTETYVEEVRTRLAVAQTIHDEVIPPLEAVALALSSGHALSRLERDLCSRGIASGVAELRSILVRDAAAPSAAGRRRSIAEIVGRARGRHIDLPVTLAGPDDVVVQDHVEPLVEHFMSEALTNAERHARPSVVEVAVDRRPEALCIDVDNDGASADRTDDGIGLRLVAQHALQHHALLNWSRPTPQHWRVRLVVPVSETSR